MTSSRGRATRHTDRSVAADLTEPTQLGEVYVAGLMRAQLRLSASILLVGALLLGAIPAILAMWPATRGVRVGPFPLPWLVLGVAAYPVAVGAGRFYVRASENLEAAFVDVVTKS
ncbi:MAG: hypothetical protein U0Q21_05455 [Dermatophilaceae bacterium]